MPPYLTRITLTSHTGDDHRTFHLIPGKSHIVGRASRNKDKMRAAADNALFDCAVMSREHAEIRSSPFSAAKSVTITDKNSLHGTTVNKRKLRPLSPFALKTGDVIQFGEQISRGEEAYDGVSVTVKLVHPLDDEQAGDSYPTLPYARGFHVPDDSEQSDFDSDVESLVSNPQDRSSAKTTPEQPQMGSQKQPIDLEKGTASQKTIISLLDDEEGTVGPSGPAANASQPAALSIGSNSSSVVQESINVAAAPLSSTEPRPASIYGILESDFDEDENDSITGQDTGLSRILNEPDTASGGSLQPDGESDAAQYVDFLFEEDDGMNSLDGSPEPSDDEGEGSVFEAMLSTNYERQPSEELGESSVLAPKPAWLDDFVEKAAAASKRRYDPVRSSQPPEDNSANPAPPAPSTYTYAPWLDENLTTNLATDTSDSSRWDMQPTSSSKQETFPTVLPSSFIPPATADSWPTTQETRHSGPDVCSLPQTTQTYGTSTTATTSDETASASRKEAMAIGNLCAPQQQIPNVAEAIVPPNASRPPLPPAVEQIPDVTVTGKRKVDAIEDSQSVEPAAKRALTAEAASASQRATAVATSQRKVTQGLVRQIAGTAAKYTACATVSSAATVAFLTSTYAERLIQYLS